MKQKNPHLKYYISAIIIGVMIVFGIVYLLRADKSAHASWWDASWLYRKSIGITNLSGDPFTNYQIKIFNNLDLSSEINLGKIQNSLNDLRFTDINGNLLSYWIEDTTSTSVDVWLRIADIPESGTSVYMYYGNSIANPGKSEIGTISFPALSCKSILLSGSSTESRNYWVDLTNGYLSDEQEVYCDMDNNDGGWMLVKPSMVSSVITRYVGVSASTDSNGGASYTFTHQDVGCDSNDTGATVQVTSTIQWDKVRAKHSIISGLSYCWSMDGTGNYGGQRVNSNLETFSVGTDIVQGCVLSCEDPQFVIPPLTRCDDAAENYAIYNGTSERSFELVSRRKNRTSASGPALGLSCNDMNMTSKIENIYIKEDYLTYSDVAVGLFSGQELALGIAGVSATLGGKTSATLTSPIVYYNFDEGYGTTTYNYVSSTPNGIITGASWVNDGKFGKALSFVGSNNYVFINNNPQSYSSFSVWLKTNSASEQVIASGMFDNSDILIEGGKIVKSSVTGLESLKTINAFNDNNWHHIVVIKTGLAYPSNFIFYVDGKIQQTVTSTNARLAGKQLIGARYTSGNYSLFFNGSIDEAKIYDYALTSDQVRLDYNQGMAIVMGQSGTSTSASSEYCVPGDTSYCASPIAEYKFEKKSGAVAYDTSGNNNNGTIIGASSVIGKFGSAINFSATNNYITGPIINTGTQMTVSFWFNRNNLADVQRIVGFGAIGSYPQIGLSGNSLFIHTTTNVGTDANIPYIVLSLSSNTWYYMTVTWDVLKSSANVIVYLNGRVVGTGTLVNSKNGIFNSSNFWMGHTTQSIKGVLDDVKIYNYARTPAQIAWDYNKGAPIVHYKFDECSNTTIHDESGNGNNGTIVIGTSGSQSAAGTCIDNSTASAWYNGRNGKYKSSLSFDGSDDYVDITTNGYTSNISVSFWFNTTSNNPEMVIFANGNGGTAILDSVGLDEGAIAFSQNSSSYKKETVSKFNDGLWHHAVLDTENKKIYVDGIEQSLIDSSMYRGSVKMIVGARYLTSYSRFFIGKIDDLKIFNYALTPEQVKLEYSGSALKFN